MGTELDAENTEQSQISLAKSYTFSFLWNGSQKLIDSKFDTRIENEIYFILCPLWSLVIINFVWLYSGLFDSCAGSSIFQHLLDRTKNYANNCYAISTC